jgi:hypothetical protein
MQGPWAKAVTFASTVVLPTMVVGVLLARGYETVGWITTVVMSVVALAAAVFLWRAFNKFWSKMLSSPPQLT